jgi:hypothetical protein
MENSSNSFLFYLYKKKSSYFFFRNIAQMLQAKGETIHRVTVAPTNDESILKEAEESTEKLKLNDGTISTS